MRGALGILLLAAACGTDGGDNVGETPAPTPDASVEPVEDASTDPIDSGALEDAGVDAATNKSAGCVSGTGITGAEQTLTLAGNARRYFVYLPTGYDKTKAWPVVFALHPNGSNASFWNATTGDRNIRDAAKNDAVVIVTEAIGGNWRDYAQPAASWPARMDLELDYFDTIVARLSKDLCIDTTEMYAMGFSGGGSFAGVLGCRRSYIKAIAAGGAVLCFDEKVCANKPATWTTMGAMELAERGTTFRDFFRDSVGCATTSKPTDPNPPCIAYDGCAVGKPTHYCQHAAGHEWPAFGTAAAWSYFKALMK